MKLKTGRFKSRCHGSAMGLGVMLATLASAASAMTTFTGTGDWNNPANWSAGVPAAGDEAVVEGAATLTNATPELASLTVHTGATVTFDGWDTLLSATEVLVAGTLTHGVNTATSANSLGVWVPNARVNIACSNLTVSSDGEIDASLKGYLGGQTANQDGCGPGRGRGRGTDSSDGGAAGYGGFGGLAYKAGFMAYGLTYGTASAPVEPGSGGGSGNRDTAAGGTGGGAVRIVALGTVTVDGAIHADGGTGPTYGGAGSGGGIFIVCERLAGSGGVVGAVGGTGGNRSGGGGGGRIAVFYDAAVQAVSPVPGIRFTALPGAAIASYANLYGDVGTLYFTDNQLLTRATGILAHSGQWVTPGLADWRPDSLALDDAWLRFPQEGLQVYVTNGVSLSGTDSLLHKLELTNAVLSCGGNAVVGKSTLTLWAGEDVGSSLICGGDLVVTNAAALHVYCGSTNLPSQACSARVAVSGNLSVASGAWIYPHSHPVMGGYVQFEAADLDIADSTCGFNASGLGYAGGQKSMVGYGPGGGVYQGGGGYGGFGGGWTATQGIVNGTDDEPRGPGSGGGGGDNLSAIGGNGGGAIVMLVPGDVSVNGSLLANGGKYAGNGHAAGGSGGGIYIVCRTFAGSGGVVSAVGGQGDYNGGGGGRIAIVYDAVAQSNTPLHSVKFTALPGTAVGNNRIYGDVGTLWFPDAQFLTRETGTIRHCGQWKAPGMTSLSRAALALDGAWLRFPVDLDAVEVTGGIGVTGTDAKLHKLEFTAADVVCGGDIVLNKSWLGLNVGEESPSTLSCAGDLVVTNGAQVHAYGGATNDVASTSGLLVDVAGDLLIYAGSWMHPYSHPTNGGSVQIKVRNLYVPSVASGIDGSGRGYRGGLKNEAGYGPGRGLKQCGGGHGGGGSGRSGLYGQVNGVARLPVGAGSGGGGGDQSFSVGGFGGAAVLIQAESEVLVNGSVLSNGGAGNAGAHDAGGAGGGIFIACRRFSGTSGVIAANGGTGRDNRSGGGGRIAIWQNVPPDYDEFLTAHAVEQTMLDGFTGTVAVTAPASGIVPAAESGTIRYYTLNPWGAVIVVR